LNNKPIPDLQKFASQMEQVLTMKIDDRIINTVSHASKVYLAGRNNGVTEELALKTNEITHKKSQFLPGTLAVHGIEEVMSKEETLIIIDPFESEEKKFKQALADNVGMKVFAISTHQTLFPTIFIPEGGYFHNYLELAAGWNLLVEVGIHLDVNLDKGLRARKIGNEFKDTLN